MASQKFLVDLDLQGHKLKGAVLGTTVGTATGAIWFDAATGRVKFIDAAGATQIVAPQSFVASEVADEAASRASEITRVEGLVSAEEAARILAISGLTLDLSNEVSAREAAVSAVAADLSDEATARQNAISNLEGDLNQEILDRAAADLNLSTDISNEATARQNADADLQDAIDAVAADLAALDTNFATDASVTAAVAAEETRAMAAEGAIASDLADEVTARGAAVGAVAGDLADEVTAREAAVSAVANDLADEVANRQTAVTGVSNTLADEISRVETGINEVADFLDAEILNRQNAVSGVSSDLSDEVTRATNAESALDLRIDDLEDATSTYALSATVASDLASEATRADAYADAAALVAENNAKAHADQIAQGLNVKEAVRTIVMQGPGLSQPLTGTYTAYSAITFDPVAGEFVIDPNDVGVALAVGDHVIVSEWEGSPSTQGIYTVQSGAWTLREDWDNDPTKTGSFAYVVEGWFAGTTWAAYEVTSGATTYYNFTQLTGIPQLYVDDPSINLSADGFGISVNVDYLVEMQGFARKATGAIAIGSGTSHTISHSLGQDVVVSVRKISTSELVQAQVVCNTGSVVITLNESPADSGLVVTIIG